MTNYPQNNNTIILYRVKRDYWLLYILILFLLSFLLSGCTLYTATEADKKIDSKQNRVEFPKEAYDTKHVSAQKNKNILHSYKLDGGLDALKKLAIVKDAKIQKDQIRVEFFVKNTGPNEQSIEEIIWDNSLFLFYTVYDTFPQIKKIRLSADYYFLDQYGNPYKEKIFITNTNRNQLKLINRDYFKPKMLSGIVDFYMEDSLQKDKKPKNKN